MARALKVKDAVSRAWVITCRLFIVVGCAALLLAPTFERILPPALWKGAYQVGCLWLISGDYELRRVLGKRPIPVVGILLAILYFAGYRLLCATGAGIAMIGFLSLWTWQEHVRATSQADGKGPPKG